METTLGVNSSSGMHKGSKILQVMISLANDFFREKENKEIRC